MYMENAQVRSMMMKQIQRKMKMANTKDKPCKRENV